MTTSTVYGPGLEDLALDTICLGRDLVRAASLADLGAGNPKFGEMAQVLLRLADRNPFRPEDDHFLRALRIVLGAEVAREVIGTERLVSSADDCEPGEFFLPRERPIYSERGQRLVEILDIFDRFMAAREAALDRAASLARLAALYRLAPGIVDFLPGNVIAQVGPIGRSPPHAFDENANRREAVVHAVLLLELRGGLTRGESSISGNFWKIERIAADFLTEQFRAAERQDESKSGTSDREDDPSLDPPIRRRPHPGSLQPASEPVAARSTGYGGSMVRVSRRSRTETPTGTRATLERRAFPKREAQPDLRALVVDGLLLTRERARRCRRLPGSPVR